MPLSARPPRAAGAFTPEEHTLLAEFYPLDLAEVVLTADAPEDVPVAARGHWGLQLLEDLAAAAHTLARVPWPVAPGLLVVATGVPVRPRGDPAGVWVPAPALPGVRVQVAHLVIAAQLAARVLARECAAEAARAPGRPEVRPLTFGRADVLQLATNYLIPEAVLEELHRDRSREGEAYALAPWRVVAWRRLQQQRSHERQTER